MTIRSLTLSFALSLAAACGGADTPAENTTPAATEPPAAEQPAAPSAEQPAADTTATDARSPSSLPVEVKNLAKGADSPSSKPVALTATSGLNQITLHVDNFTHYCSPTPAFSASVTGDVVTVGVRKPEGAVSRCAAPYSLDVVLQIPGRNNVRTVSLVGVDGKELGKATVTSGK